MSLAGHANHPPEKEQTMKVGELIEMLQQYDPEAELYLAEQPSWPFLSTRSPG